MLIHIAGPGVAGDTTPGVFILLVPSAFMVLVAFQCESGAAAAWGFSVDIFPKIQSQARRNLSMVVMVTTERGTLPTVPI